MENGSFRPGKALWGRAERLALRIDTRRCQSRERRRCPTLSRPSGPVPPVVSPLGSAAAPASPRQRRLRAFPVLSQANAASSRVWLDPSLTSIRDQGFFFFPFTKACNYPVKISFHACGASSQAGSDANARWSPGCWGVAGFGAGAGSSSLPDLKRTAGGSGLPATGMCRCQKAR